MRISVILELEEVGAGAEAGAACWLDMAIATGDGVLSWQKRMRGKARPFVKNARARLYFQHYSSDVTTWMGNTHVETDILPSSSQHGDFAGN